MLSYLRRLPRLAIKEKNRTTNLLSIPAGSSCLFSFRDDGNQEKNRKEIPRVPAASFHRRLIDSFLPDEQPNVSRSYDPGRP